MRAAPSITLALDSPSTFSHLCLDFRPDAQLINAWKTLGVEINGAYQFPLKNYQEVIRSLSRYHPNLKVNGIARGTLDAMIHAMGVKLPPREQLLDSVPPAILNHLYEYQRDGVAFGIAHGGRVLLADEMGVGKSLQGIALFAAYQWEWPALLLCPSSLKGKWAKELKLWLMPLQENPQFAQRYAVYLNRFVVIIDKGTDVMDGLINICSYDLAGGSKEQELAKRNFQVTLLDESHSLKSRDAKRTKALIPILQRAKRIILLSGTPSLNRPAEIFPQVHLLRRDVFSSFHAFGERYCDAQRDRYGWHYDGHSNLQELNVVLSTICMIRRTKAVVLSELPTKTRERVALKLTAEQREVVKKGLSKLRQVESSKSADPITKKAAFMTLWREIGRVKLPSVVEYVNDLIQAGERFVLFAHHQFILDELETFLTRKKVSFIRIDGKTKSSHRTRMVDEFQSADAGGDGGAPQVALLSITAAGVGIELFSAHTVVFAELYWTCGALVQAEDRCHRIGQTHDVTIHYLLAENTADEQIWFILRRKMDIVGQMLGTDEARLDADQVSYDGEIHETDMREFINALCDRGPLDSLDASTDGTCADQVVVPADQSTLDSFFQRSTPKKAPKRRKVQVTLPNWEPKKFDVASPEAPEALDVPETRPVATTLTSVATPASEAQQATQTPSLLKVKMPDPSKYMIY